MASFVTTSRDILTKEGGRKMCLADMGSKSGQEPHSMKEGSIME